MSGCGSEIGIKNQEESRVLIALLIINAVMFLVEVVLGVISDSTALIADSFDMLADAMVYSIALYAVGRSASSKIKAAHLSGITQVLLGLCVMFDVIRRLIWGSEPISVLMMSVGTVALIANIYCLTLIAKHRKGEIHMRASWIFSTNDVVANIGIIASGILIYTTGSRLPDLVIGFCIALFVVYGGVTILRESAMERKQLTDEEP